VILDGLEEHLIAAPLKKRSQINVTTPYDYLAALESGRTANEAARLLYVGATRAIRHLHLVGVANLNAKTEIKAPANSFLGLLWPALADHFALPNRPADVLGAATPVFIPKLLRIAEPIRIDLPIRQVAAAAEVGGGDESDMGNSLDALVGTLTHRYLEMMAREGLDCWPAARLTGLRGAMETWLSQQGCGDRDAALAAQRVASMLATTLASDEGRWLLARHQSAETELALARADATGATLHVVDRTFVANGERWIVDYKTTSVAGDLAERAANYRPQLERYASLFATDDRPPRLAIYFVATGRLIEVPAAA
jgi:ATP-dependent exoDNAse (exonuclease V) beta subunit